MTTIVTPKPAILKMPVPNTDGDYIPVHLDRRCNNCEGIGIVGNPAWDAFNEKYQGSVGPESEWPTDGYGNVVPEEITCSECEGRGLVLTDFGRELLTFLRRHGLNGVFNR